MLFNFKLDLKLDQCVEFKKSQLKCPLHIKDSEQQFTPNQQGYKCEKTTCF